MKPSTAQLIAAAEAEKALLQSQGWTPKDLGRALALTIGGATSGDAPLRVAAGGACEVGSAKFSPVEAQYLLAAAATARGGKPASSVGVTDEAGQRWLLSSTRAHVTLVRGATAYRMRPKQVTTAFASTQKLP